MRTSRSACRVPFRAQLTYLRIALEGLAYRAPHFRITADGETIERASAARRSVANAQYWRQSHARGATARTDDGRLDVLAVRELSLLAVWPKLVKLYTGRILGDRAVRHCVRSGCASKRSRQP